MKLLPPPLTPPDRGRLSSCREAGWPGAAPTLLPGDVEQSGPVTVHSLRAAAFDLPNQNLVEERVEHHVAKVDCKGDSTSG